MIREDWQQKRVTKDVLGANVLQKTIDDYEVKLCESHTKILNLEHDLKNAKERIIEEKNNTREERIKKDRYNQYWMDEQKKNSAVKKEAELMLENCNTKWYQVSTRQKIVSKIEHHLRYGY